MKGGDLNMFDDDATADTVPVEETTDESSDEASSDEPKVEEEEV